MDYNSITTLISLIIALIASIVSPFLTSVLNNNHTMKMETLRNDFAEKRALNERKITVFQAGLQSLGGCLSNPTHETIQEAGTFLYSLYLYLPKEHWPELDNIISCFQEDSLSKKLPDYLIKLSHLLSDEINSEQLSD